MTSTLTAKQQYWSEHLAYAERSGQSLSKYAKVQNISAQTLYQWRSSLKRATTRTVHEEVCFAEVLTPNLSAHALSLHYCDTSLQLSVLPEADWIARLVHQLKPS
ncbi:MAG: transposase-like protein [Granulosicoccus sp.]|jgi:hypothetical protein